MLALTVAAFGCSKKKGSGGEGASKTKTDTAEARRVREANLASFDYVWTTVRDKHWDKTLGGVDWNAVRDELRPKVEKAASTEEARQVMEEMLSRLGQSHFGIVPASAYEEIERPDEAKPGPGDDKDAGQAGEEAGSGTTGIDVRVVGDQALVWRVSADSPAAAAGVHPGWRVVKVDDKAVAEIISRIDKAFSKSTLLELMLSRAVDGRLSGDVGTKVAVVFEDGDGKEQRLELDCVEPKGKLVVFGNMPALYVVYESRTVAPGIGYVTFNVFLDPASTMEAFNRDMAAFAEDKGIIIDLRGNPGGLGPMAMGMGGWFVTDATKSLGTMKTRDSEVKFVLSPRPTPYTGKVAVLIDGLSASTSEILAAGLRDLGLARLFGTRSAGAALPSVFERLPNGDGFQYAIGNYVSASGEVLEGKGVTPDQVVPLTRAALLQGRDPVIDAAIAWIDTESEK